MMRNCREAAASLRPSPLTQFVHHSTTSSCLHRRLLALPKAQDASQIKALKILY